MKRSLAICVVIMFLSILSATDVSGNQSGLWILADSPYNVIGDITIPAGLSLHIDPGVTVNAMGNYRITAAGQFYALGTQADSIRFLNGQADPNALWKGIRLESTTQGSQIGFCYIEKCEYGINSINSPAVIHHNRFYKNQKGMQIYGIGATDPAQVIVSANLIEWSVQNGILVVQNSNAVIIGNELRYNGTGTQYMAAIQLSNQSTGGANSPAITSNFIHHNFKQGITAWDIVGANAINPEITGNTIEYNLTGIYLLNASGYVGQNIIRDNFITGDTNSGAGVMVAGATSHPYFEQNQIYGNYTGFYIGTNAQPCLGNMAINHIWAQGENEIYDNIDGSNLLHSVYCYSYTTPGITIYAENNYWGTNSPLEIPVGIQDHTDDASLPTVDFDPIMTQQLTTTITGSVFYNGIQSITNTRIQFVAEDDGEILEDFPVNNGENFTLEVSFLENFHAVVLAYIDGTGDILYGCAGGFSEPSVFSPGDFVPVDVGMIEIQDLQPPRYQGIGAPVTEGAHTLYPVYNSLLVYHWDYINWLYQEGDYLYIKRHTRYNDAENITFTLPDGTTWDKIANFTANDNWTRTEIMDDSGTQRLSDFSVKTVSDAVIVDGGSGTREFYTLFLQTDAVSDSLISSRMIGSEIRRLCHYKGSYVWRCEDIIPNVGAEYLLEGNSWDFIPIVPIYSPSFLSFDFYEHYTTNIHNLTLYWQAPADDGAHNWNQYIIFNNDMFYGAVPFGQNYWHAEGLPNETFHLTVAAYNGTNYSAFTNDIWVSSVAADDPVEVPLVIAVQPNPASHSADSNANIVIQSGKALSGQFAIYNLRGQLVKSLTITSDGDFTYRWDLKDAKGNPCASGIYFLKAEIKGENSLIRRMALIK